MGEQCDGGFLAAACSNSAQQCLKTMWYFSEMVRRKNPVWKLSSSTNCYIIIYWPFTDVPTARYCEARNSIHATQKHRATEQAAPSKFACVAQMRGFPRVKKHRSWPLIATSDVFSHTLERNLFILNNWFMPAACARLTKALLVNLLATNKPETARARSSGAHEEPPAPCRWPSRQAGASLIPFGSQRKSSQKRWE